ncbi:MAG TPA: response regulator transcription factor [Opitutaceae bacterium]|nr:response regulator transcription factor [Opitutaceae bacterium]
MKTVLLVDDVPANLGVLLDVLSAAGYAVRVAESGERALTQMREARPDLILVDVMMPGLDGLETCRRLKADPAWRAIPVIFMTALSDVVDKVKGFEAGGVDYITKPLHPQEVLARVRAHLELRELQQALEEEVDRRSALEAQLRQSLDRAVLMVAEDGSVPFCTRRAEQMLVRHGGAPGGTLPAAFTRWLGAGPAAPLEIDGPAGRLRARRFVEPGTTGLCLLVLEEDLAAPPPLDGLEQLGLTPREAEVLYWIAQGKTNPEIAVVLDSAANTVKKHAQNVLNKLGVETRTAAARIALDALGGSAG